MPRTSPYVIILTSEERQALEHKARSYTLPFCDVVRARAILLAADGLETNEIARELPVTRRSVWKWRQRFVKERLDGLENRPRRGRPGTFSPSGHH